MTPSSGRSSSRLNADGSYTLTRRDRGMFATLAGVSPGACNTTGCAAPVASVPPLAGQGQRRRDDAERGLPRRHRRRVADLDTTNEESPLCAGSLRLVRVPDGLAVRAHAVDRIRRPEGGPPAPPNTVDASITGDEDPVSSRPAVDNVLPVSGIEEISAFSAAQNVVVPERVDDVVARTGVDKVSAVGRGGPVVAAATRDPIVSGAREDDVPTRGADNAVCARGG